MPHTPLLLPRPRRLAGVSTGPSRADLRRSAVRIDPAQATRPEGYSITVGPESVEAVAHDPPGAFYARQTLGQLQLDREITGHAPCLRIEDWPSFPHRGVMLDVSRDKVPTMGTLRSLVDLFASLKINQLQLYTEHAFAYRGHEDVWRSASPITPDEVRSLDAYCRERFIELVPNQNTFGHMERWLRHERYKPLAEAPEGFTWPWGGRFEGGFSLNPTDARSLELVEDLLDQLLPCFSSRQVNVGCDETFDVGQGRSAAAVARLGEGRVYAAYLRQVLGAAQRRGVLPQFWGDIIVKHPELLSELPRGITALSWGYEADFNFDEQLAKFAAAGLPFYVCPGTSSWLSLGGRSDNAIGNLRAAAAAGVRHGAVGILNTDWGDHGHWQPLPVSYLPFAYGAAVAWNALDGLDVSELLAWTDRFIFRDGTDAMARIAYDLGNAHRVTGLHMKNASPLHAILRRPDPPPGLTVEGLRRAAEYVDQVAARLDATRLAAPDAALVLDEFRHVVSLQRYACRAGLALLAGQDTPRGDESMIENHRRVWLARNREGGLGDSVRRLRQGLRLEPFTPHHEW